MTRHGTHRVPARAALLACIGLAVVLPACQRSSAVKFRGQTMGTTFTVKVVGLPTNVDADQLGAEIESLLAHINQLMSNYLADSELSRLNRFQEADWFDLSSETHYVLERAQRVGEASDGAFDIAIGPLVRLWNFGPGREGPDRIPVDEDISRVLERMGSRQFELRNEPPGVRKMRPDLELDLSALAKGFAVDEVENRLLSHGVTNYLVEIGGEVQTGGLNAEGEPWRIAVEAPLAEVREIQRVIPLTQTALATSGDYRNYFEVDGQRYSHILDPRTGKPVDHNLVSVSVLHPSCTLADAWATALLVLGPNEGQAVAEQEALAVLFIVRQEEGFTEIATPQFEAAVDQMRAGNAPAW
jgi:thiamine biosynthesis lipoprotein